MVLAGCFLANTILSYFCIETEVLSYIAGIGILPLLFIYLSSKLVEQYEDVLSQINPNPNGEELKELKQQFSTMQSQFSELMSILKSKQNT